jgi:hypothetical protein
MPKAAGNNLWSAFCCFPPASPVFGAGAGKHETDPRDRSKPMIGFRKFGAGEGIRTPDPNLGKGGKGVIQGRDRVSRRTISYAISKVLLRRGARRYPAAGVVGGHHVDTTIEIRGPRGQVVERFFDQT